MASGNRFWRVLLILLALETGFFLILVPWSSVWDRNFLLGYLASLQPILRSHYVRGAVSALGVVNIWLGLAEAVTLYRLGRRPPGADD
ncbi:MAG: hypothetical protein HYX73_05930 [Acidobacteria bacterium]|nr:hypothetical protein [Acidobacteriota bacterium]